jgi:phage terminase large subunit
VVEVTKGKDSIKSGIDRIRELFKANKLHIHKSCINLISELETYSYPDKKDDHNEQEKPIKENDHALDALRYVIMTDQVLNQSPQVRVIQETKFISNINNRQRNSSK